MSGLSFHTFLKAPLPKEYLYTGDEADIQTMPIDLQEKEECRNRRT